jgi:hypothetical protein
MRGVHVEPFEVAITDAVLDDLRERIRRTRWPDPAPGEPWSQGTDLGYLRDLLAYWADGFDWRSRERDLNRFEHRICTSSTITGPTPDWRWSSPTAGRARSWSSCLSSSDSAIGSISSSLLCPDTHSRHVRGAPVWTARSSRACGTS